MFHSSLKLYKRFKNGNITLDEGNDRQSVLLDNFENIKNFCLQNTGHKTRLKIFWLTLTIL